MTREALSDLQQCLNFHEHEHSAVFSIRSFVGFLFLDLFGLGVCLLFSLNKEAKQLQKSTKQSKTILSEAGLI